MKNKIDEFIDAISNSIATIIVMFFMCFLAQLVWNAIIPEVFNGPVLTYWQTLGLMFLSTIFFKGVTYKK